MSRYRRQFFIPPTQVNGDHIVILDTDARHIVRVLRLGPGDTIRAVVDEGRSYAARIKKILPESVECVLLSQVVEKEGPGVEVVLAQALPRGRAMESIIRRATELGIYAVAPIETERCVSRLKGDNAHQKTMRWRKIAAEAAKQCSRLNVPEIMEVQPFNSFLQDGAGLKIMLHEEEKNLGLKAVFSSIRKVERVNVLVGAEGGFTPREVEAAGDSGYSVVSLGPRVLRVETASAALLSILMYEMGEMAP